ncbi:MAG: hypothetical protein NC253_12860 [Ruminococcus sp.]|nr:hypothetical protein [Ruminococcus sp.]
MSEKNSAKNGGNVHEGHRERMRKRFRETGSFDGFSEHEIIEMLLFYVCPRRNTNEIAHELIKRFGGVAGVIEANYEELMKVSYITENAATLFKIIPQIMPIYYNSKNMGNIYNTPQKLIELFEPYFVGLAYEKFLTAYFDNKLSLIKVAALGKGDPSGAAVNIRELVEIALRENASAVAIAHNHPKTDPRPSLEDINTTKNIIGVLEKMRIDFLDHIIVGESQSLSLSDSAYITFLNT